MIDSRKSASASLPLFGRLHTSLRARSLASLRPRAMKYGHLVFAEPLADAGPHCPAR
jgi:hypothetical protein